ncbi:MAG: cytochrome c oxidase assembly protein [Gaiellales bacterium]
MSATPWAFTFEPLFALAAVLAALAWVRQHRRGQASSEWWRPWCLGAGLVLIAGSLNSPLETIAVDYLVLFHLLQNVIIGDWGPALLLLGLTPTMRTAIAARGGSAFAHLTRPHVALPVWLVGWYLLHLSAVYDAAVRSTLLLHFEHAGLIALGLLFWWPVLVDAPAAVGTLARIAYVFVAFVGSVFLGLVLTFAPPLYDHYAELDVRLWGISAEADQSLGGVLMSTEQVIVLGAALVWLLVRLLREEEAAEAALAARQRAEGLVE